MKVTTQLEEVVRRIQKLEDAHAYLEQEILKPMISHDSQISNRKSTFATEVLSSFDLTTDSFCWHWLHGDQEQRYFVKMGSIAPAKVVSQPWSNTNCCCGKNTLWPWSSSFDILDEIKWEDLMIRERIKKGIYYTCSI